MAEGNDTPATKALPYRSYRFVTDDAIPIEQRTDVTVDELERMSLPCTAELYDGRIVLKEANMAHGMIQAHLAAMLSWYLDENPIGYAMISPNFRLWPDRPKESRAPDVALVKKWRMRPEDWHCFPAIAPDLAVEIISPDDKFEAMMEKVDEYLESGVQIVWLGFSTKCEILVCTSSSTYHRVRDVLTAPELLPGFELPVSRIFEGIPLPENS